MLVKTFQDFSAGGGSRLVDKPKDNCIFFMQLHQNQKNEGTENL